MSIVLSAETGTAAPVFNRNALNAILSHFAALKQLAATIAATKIYDLSEGALAEWAKAIADHSLLAEERVTDTYDALQKKPQPQAESPRVREGRPERRRSFAPPSTTARRRGSAVPPNPRSLQRSQSTRVSIPESASIKGDDSFSRLSPLPPATPSSAAGSEPETPLSNFKLGAPSPPAAPKPEQAQAPSQAPAGGKPTFPSPRQLRAQAQGAKIPLTPQQTVQSAVHLLVETLCYRCRATKGICFIHVEHAGELRAIAGTGMPASKVKKITASASSGIAGVVLQTGVAINLTHGQVVTETQNADETDPAAPSWGAFTAALSGLQQSLNRTQRVADNEGGLNPIKHKVPKKSLANSSRALLLAAGQLNSPSSFNSEYARSALLFPIRSLQSKKWVGVVQVTNKVSRTDSFTTEDELEASACAKMLSYLLERYPVGFLTMPSFDPSALHSVVPFELPPHEAPGHLPGGGGSPIVSSFVPSLASSLPDQQMIYRTVHSGKFIRRKTVNNNKVALSSGAATLREVDGYVENLEECWRTNITKTVELEQKTAGKEGQLQAIRTDLRKTKEKVRQLREQQALSEDY